MYNHIYIYTYIHTYTNPVFGHRPPEGGSEKGGTRKKNNLR